MERTSRLTTTLLVTIVAIVVLTGSACAQEPTPTVVPRAYLPIIWTITEELRPPTDLSTRCHNYYDEEVRWRDTNTSESGYVFQWQIEGDYRGETHTAILPANTESYNITLVPMNTFTVTVQAFRDDLGGGKSYSGWTSLTVKNPPFCPPGPPLFMPTDLDAKCHLYTLWDVSWTDNNKWETAYEALWTIKGEYRGGTHRILLPADSTGFQFDLLPLNVFTATVRAVFDKGGSVSLSDWASLTVTDVKYCPPGQP